MSAHTKESRKMECLRNERYILYWRGRYNLGDVFSDMFFEAMYDRSRLDMLHGRKLMSFIGSEIPLWAKPDVLVCGLGWRVKGARLRCSKVPPDNIMYTRGRISRTRLADSGVQVPSDLPVGDTGLLASLIYSPKCEKKHDIGIIAHYAAAGHLDEYRRLAEETFTGRSVAVRHMGDLDMDCRDLFEFISSCRVVVAGSLHAIVFSHSLGVPALFFSNVNGYKFEDYYSVYDRIRYDDITRSTSLSDALEHIDDEDFIKSVNPTVDEVKAVQRSILEALPYQECLSEFGRSLVHPSSRYRFMQCSDPEVLSKSSSGGVVPALARHVMGSGGAYFGVVFSDDFSCLKYVEVDDSTLERSMGSKYIDVRLSDDLFARMKSYLESGRDVMFVGRPCQCLWLRQMFPGNRHLILVELMCFGVPEASIWARCLARLSGDHGSLSSFSFRDKKYSWEGYRLSAEFSNGDTVSVDHTDSQYMKDYLDGRNLKAKCRGCTLGTKTPSLSDVVCGDAWGIGRLGVDPGKGWSIAIANTAAGGKLLDRISTGFKVINSNFDCVQSIKKLNRGLSRAVGSHRREDHEVSLSSSSEDTSSNEDPGPPAGALLAGVSVEDLVGNAFCISVDRRRRENFTRIFSKMFGVVPMFFDGYTDNPVRRKNCDCSHMAVIKMAKAMGLPYVTIFEDDAFPRPDAKELLEYCMRNVPDDAAMVLWGFGHSPGGFSRVNDYMRRVPRPSYLWGSQAYTIFKSGYDKYSELYPRPADQYWGLVGPTYMGINCFIQHTVYDNPPKTPGFCSMYELISDDLEV